MSCMQKNLERHGELSQAHVREGDKTHREWIDSKGLSFANLMLTQSTEPGNRGYKTLSDLLEKEAPKIG